MDDAARAETVTRAFRIIHDIQAGVPGATDELAALGTLARDAGWDDVVRAYLFGEAVASWIRGDDAAAGLVRALVEQSEEAGDAAMLALGLALRSDQGFSGADLGATALYDGDLARAIALLEPERGRPCERISAHTACAIALGNRWLFELSHEQYAAALAIGDAEPKGTLDFLLAPIRFNLAEEQVSWASKLYELGDAAAVEERWAAWNQAVAQTEAYSMSESWRVELDALGLVLRALAGGDVTGPATHHLSELGDDGGDARAGSLLRLAVAVSLAQRAAAQGGGDGVAGEGAQDREVAAAIDAATTAISPVVHPFMYDLALFLAAEAEGRRGSGAGLRYARRVAQEQWAKRDAALMAMRSQIASVRVVSERDHLSRLARLDDLTGIANRWALEEFLSDLISRRVERCALVLFDVDSFKAVNDVHGHLAGDRLLVRIAEVLSRGIRASDLAVRLGGDEFAVILAGAGPAAARRRAAALLRAFGDEPSGGVADGLRIRVSAGVAIGAPSTVMEMWAAADAALYEAKAAGGGVVRLAPV